MKKINLSLVAITVFALVTLCACKQDTSIEEVSVEENLSMEEPITGGFYLDKEKSMLNWKAKKVTGEHFGTIALTNGKFSFSNGQLTGGVAYADLTSIVVEDIKDKAMNTKLTEHLNSKDFFHTSEFPSATLKLDGSTDEAIAFGSLTIKDITHPIEFPFEVIENEGILTLSGSMLVDRTMYDIRYRSGKFFEDLGDKTIYDDFELSFIAVSLKQ
ncbi:MAG: YceI family protein [Chitinophagales bacterium]|nr:YceI family protein [Chitinophagales bacterium]